MGARALGLVVATALSLPAAGCGEKKTADVGPSASASAPPAIAARRPTRRYYLGRTGDRCDVYSIDGDDLTAPVAIPCPQDLEPGERMRIAGRTCIRESTDEKRQVPIVCPDPLTNLEKHDQKASSSASPAR